MELVSLFLNSEQNSLTGQTLTWLGESLVKVTALVLHTQGRVYNEVGVSIIGTCSKKAGLPLKLHAVQV